MQPSFRNPRAPRSSIADCRRSVYPLQHRLCEDVAIPGLPRGRLGTNKVTFVCENTHFNEMRQDNALYTMPRGLQDRIQQTAPFESDAQEALLNLFVASAHVRRKIEQVCRTHDLNFSHYNVLRILRGVHPNGHARCDILDRMIDPSPDVTRLMDKLVDKGFVRRSQSEADRRVTLHTITDAGLQRLEAMASDIRGVQDWFGRRVAARDLQHLSRICETIYAEYEDASE